MPRRKSYDRQDAVAKACAAFWEHGFQALGVRELEQITGINQFAIRSEFGGKEGLYLEALSYYSDAAITGEMAPMVDGDISDIIRFLRGLVTPGSMTSSDYGCLIVNTGVENARVKSPRLATAVQEYWATLARHFERALENEAQRQGDAARFTPADVAQALVPAVMGVHVQNRTRGTQTAGRGLVELLCAMLEDLRTPA
ncbi:MAG: TetR/AcrR family transcriptional regulator [Pseudomonadota bacterium]